MKTLLLAIILIGIAFLGIAIKMFFIKDSTFTKTCGSVDPKTGKRIACTCGHSDDGNKSSCNNS